MTKQELVNETLKNAGLKVEVIPDIEGACPECGAYWGNPNTELDFPNRSKVHSEGEWWWKCYNPACKVEYYTLNGCIEFRDGRLQYIVGREVIINTKGTPKRLIGSIAVITKVNRVRATIQFLNGTEKGKEWGFPYSMLDATDGFWEIGWRKTN